MSFLHTYNLPSNTFANTPPPANAMVRYITVTPSAPTDKLITAPKSIPITNGSVVSWLCKYIPMTIVPHTTMKNHSPIRLVNGRKIEEKSPSTLLKSLSRLNQSPVYTPVSGSHSNATAPLTRHVSRSVIIRTRRIYTTSPRVRPVINWNINQPYTSQTQPVSEVLIIPVIPIISMI